MSSASPGAAQLRILADENIPAVEHYAGALATVRRFSGRALTADQLAGVDALFVRSVTAVNAELLEGSSLRFVGTATSGVDHIDCDYLRRQGIGFSHAPGSNANSVVEYVLAAVAACGDHLEQLLSGAVVGIIGYGVIGKAVAARLRALGIACKVYDPWLDPATVENPANLADILTCQVISLHAELTLEQPWPSYHLLSELELAQIPRGSLLINASRGSVVDNAALLALVNHGNSPQVVLDVWEGEPAINPELLEKVQLGTPHIAGYSLDGKLLATAMLLDALTRELGLPQQNTGSAAADAPALRIPQGLEGAQLLRAVLAQRYDIGADDRALRAATLDTDPRAVAAAFDQLRRDYTQRREVVGSVIASGSISGPALQLLIALGCRPVSGSG